MAENSAKKLLLSIVAVVLVGGLGGLGAAVLFKKGSWLGRDKAASGNAEIPDPLFYTQIGDSPATPMADQGVPGSMTLDVKFTIEIAKFPIRDQAESLIRTLAQKGLDAYYTPLLKDGRVIYRVRYGIFDTEASAKAAAKSVQAKLNPAGLKVRVSSM
ncbi:MAG: hypothetical protein RIQ81_1537 [Pseudomonadota bacterium]|jgi:cell division protein FtsN